MAESVNAKNGWLPPDGASYQLEREPSMNSRGVSKRTRSLQIMGGMGLLLVVAVVVTAVVVLNQNKAQNASAALVPVTSPPAPIAPIPLTSAPVPVLVVEATPAPVVRITVAPRCTCRWWNDFHSIISAIQSNVRRRRESNHTIICQLSFSSNNANGH